ncbi:MAG: type 1 glutamine amidotransferase [Candidatus Krumholzibacteriota bacterium]|nr:type 1 glutamine amidotransferase [Candidatus Krumholzibacteriota bacterium]
MKKKINLIDVTDFSLPDGSGSSEWFTEAFEDLGLFSEVDLVVWDGVSGELPPVERIERAGDAVMISGSYGPVFADKEWIGRLMEFIRLVHSKDIWMLGICFGHLAIAQALGGRVEANPRGREFGTVMIFLTPEGEKSPLLEGLPQGCPVNISHMTHVSQLPDSAVRLAFNQMTRVQSFSMGKTFGYQPHPEFGPKHIVLLADMLGNLLVRREKYLDDKAHLQDFKGSILETPASKAVLMNFVRMIRD